MSLQEIEKEVNLQSGYYRLLEEYENIVEILEEESIISISYNKPTGIYTFTTSENAKYFINTFVFDYYYSRFVKILKKNNLFYEK